MEAILDNVKELTQMNQWAFSKAHLMGGVGGYA